MSEIEVHGTAGEEFTPLREVFARMVADQEAGGSALAVYRDGAPVVDIWGGTYREDSLQLVFSLGKAVVAVAAAMAQERGILGLDAPIAECWPAFRRRSVAGITPRMIMSHRAGLPAFTHQVDLEGILAGDDERQVERQEPFWEPGSAHGYHAFTYGTLMNGVFTRQLGRTMAEFVDTEIADPLGIDFWFGVPTETLTRVVPVTTRPAAISVDQSRFAARTGIPTATTGYIRQSMDLSNEPRFLQASFPAVNGVSSARSIARFFEATRGGVRGGRLLSGASLADLTRTRSQGVDRVLGIPIHFGTGLQRPFPQFGMLSSASFGHEAAGGSAGFADDEHGLSVGFTTSVHPAMPGVSARFLALVSAIRVCLENR